MFADLGYLFKYVMTEGDRRTFPLFLSDPWIPLYTLIGYILLVKVIGPWYMRNREPYTLKNTLLVYNAFQVAICAYIVTLQAQDGWMWLPNWFKCKPIETKTTPEFLDVFFVLRKKQSQISFLHVYHHGTMPFFTVLTMRFSPGGSIALVGFLNSTVHVIMYGYYLLAALGPQMQKFLWWKKYITMIQMVQFSILVMHFIIVLFSNCNIPKGIALLMICNTAFNLLLFLHFYRKQYKHKTKARIITEEKPILENGLIGVKSNKLTDNTEHLNERNGATKLNSHTLSEHVKHRSTVLL